LNDVVQCKAGRLECLSETRIDVRRCVFYMDRSICLF